MPRPDVLKSLENSMSGQDLWIQYLLPWYMPVSMQKPALLLGEGLHGSAG